MIESVLPSQRVTDLESLGLQGIHKGIRNRGFVFYKEQAGHGREHAGGKMKNG